MKILVGDILRSRYVTELSIHVGYSNLPRYKHTTRSRVHILWYVILYSVYAVDCKTIRNVHVYVQERYHTRVLYPVTYVPGTYIIIIFLLNFF